jgi:hypothetical protein
MSKWVYAIPVIVVIALVASISYYLSKDGLGTKATEAPTFDLLGYQEKFKDYYGNAPLEEIARSVYDRTFSKEYPDFESWKKDAGIDSIIQEDIKRRTPPTFWEKLTGATAHVAPMRFDILGYQKANEGYYGKNAPLVDVAKDVYERDFKDRAPDFNSWVKSVGIETLIQEDIKRRAPSFIDKLSNTVNAVSGVALPFRYGEEYIQGRLYRYDRLTGTVQQKSGAEWVSIPWLKSLQHARDVLAKREKDRQNNELKDELKEELKEELEEELERNEMLTKWSTDRNIEDLKNTVETMKREQQHREMDRQNEQRIRDMKREFEEREREIRDRNRR